MQDFKKLLVWQKAARLSIKSHRIAARISGSHYTAVRSQIIRCGMSIASNIAEGRAQRSDAEFARFLNYSLASATELESHLLTCRSMGLISEADCNEAASLAIEIRRMLYAMIRKLRNDSRKPAAQR
jgi:four helix bundle protein